MRRKTRTFGAAPRTRRLHGRAPCGRRSCSSRQKVAGSGWPAGRTAGLASKVECRALGCWTEGSSCSVSKRCSQSSASHRQGSTGQSTGQAVPIAPVWAELGACRQIRALNQRRMHTTVVCAPRCSILYPMQACTDQLHTCRALAHRHLGAQPGRMHPCRHGMGWPPPEAGMSRSSSGPAAAAASRLPAV